MAKEIKKKVTFGGTDVAVIRPKPKADAPEAMNIIVSFEEALKLHLSLGQALAKLNSYNRATKAGKETAINLCLYTHRNRITVNEGKLPKTK